MLLGIELLDELYSGVPALGAPDIQRSLGTSYEATSWILLLIPGTIALVVEPWLFLRAERMPRERFIVGGLLVMALAALALAAAPGAITIALATSVAWIAAGCAVGLAQVALVETDPAGREHAMTRWTLMGTLGDLATPFVFAGLAVVGMGWRAAYVCAALLCVAFALGLARRAIPRLDAADAAADDDEDGPELGTWASLKLALGNRALVLWLFGLFLCDMLDEILVIFASLHLRDELGVGPLGRSIVMGVEVAGGVVGLVVLERLLKRVAPLRLLAGAAIGCALSYASWLFATDVYTSGALLFVVGAFAATLYPLAAAQAYATLPGRGAVVAAAGAVFAPLSLGLPWLLGAIADHAGTRAALVVLLAQPVGLLVVAMVAGRRHAPP